MMYHAEMNEEVLSAIDKELRKEQKTNVYQHYRGGLYELLHEARMEANGQHVMVYRCLTSNMVWVRPAEEFKRKFKLVEGV